MRRTRKTWVHLGVLVDAGAVALLAAPQQAPAAQTDDGAAMFTKDIAPILQRSCENCHRAGGGAPMALASYAELRRLQP